MQVINKKVHINKDGILKLEIPTQLSESDVDLVVVISPSVDSSQNEHLSESEILLVEERWEEYKKNPDKSKTWNEVKASLLKKYDL